MILKFVGCEEGKTPREVLYQCREFSFDYSEPNSDGIADAGLFTIFNEAIPYEHHVHLGHTKVYVMNDEGKTIDSYNWKYDKERKVYNRR